MWDLISTLKKKCKLYLWELIFWEMRWYFAEAKRLLSLKIKVVDYMRCWVWFGFFFLVALLGVPVSWERGRFEDLTEREVGWEGSGPKSRQSGKNVNSRVPSQREREQGLPQPGKGIKCSHFVDRCECARLLGREVDTWLSWLLINTEFSFASMTLPSLSCIKI